VVVAGRAGPAQRRQLSRPPRPRACPAVDIAVLTGVGQATGLEVSPDADQRLAAIERALLAQERYAGIDDVQEAVEEAHRDYQAARYDEVLAILPMLIAALDRQEVALVAGYYVIAKTLTKIGAWDLALVAADRAWTAAKRGGDDPADLGMAVYQVVCALLPTPRAELAEELAVVTAEQLEVGREAPVWSVAGALWLIAAVAAAGRGFAGGAAQRLDHADRLVQPSLPKET
jgi:type VI protein secretion system component VasF